MSRRLIPPLVVYLSWWRGADQDPRCVAIARDLYELLHRPFGDDPVQRPGLEIPVRRGRDLPALLDAIERGDEAAAGTRVVVMILDRAAYAAPPFRDAFKRARSAPGLVLVPVVLQPSWASEVTCIRRRWVWALAMEDHADRRWKVGAEVAAAAGHMVSGGASPRVLISHAEDGVHVAQELADHFQRDTRIAVEVTRGDGAAGDLDLPGPGDVLVVIRTDRYSEDAACAAVLLAAKRATCPVITVLANTEGEPTTSAYGGNHRTITWQRERAWEVVARSVLAWLHAHHFAAHAAVALAHAGLPADARVLPRRPELLDVAIAPGRGRDIIVYPDPPLPEDEVALLRAARPSLRLVTPNTMLGRVLLANDPTPPLAGCEVALSLSSADDVHDDADGSGITRVDVDDVIHTLVLTALHNGARLAYGGDFRDHGGYGRQLTELHRARRRLGVGAHSQLVCFLDGESPRAGELVEYEPVLVSHLPGTAELDPDVREALWHMNLRAEMAERCTACVVLGGKRRARHDGGDGFRGPWPGTLEEAAATVRAGKALYVIGGFGGFGRVVADMLIAETPPPDLIAAAEAARTSSLAIGFADARRRLVERGVDPRRLWVDERGAQGIEDLAADLARRWRAFRAGDADAWMNGLGVDDNLRLFRSQDRTEIAQLVFEGLREVARRVPAATTLEVALYHGSIASLSDVEAHAVTFTPGMPTHGAMEALDRASDGRLAREHQAYSVSEHAVCWLRLDGPLIDRRVGVARVDESETGAVSAATVRALGVDLGRACNQHGIASIAVTPFGATLGLDAGDAVKALLVGLREGRGGGTCPRIAVVCEIDRAQYGTVKRCLDGAGIGYRELLAGPPAEASGAPVVIGVDATADARGVRIATWATVPDSGSPVVPSHDAQLSTAEWEDLRRAPGTFAEALKRGAALGELLSPGMRALLIDAADARVQVIANREASGLPWEHLRLDDWAPALRGGMFRSVQLPGHLRPPSRRTAGVRVRMLLVIDPTGDLPETQPEADAVIAALRGRSDIAVDVLCKGAATVAEVGQRLRSGDYDVLHYAGHARFTGHVSDSGLVLADNHLLTAADLVGDVPPLVVLNGCKSARLRHAVPIPSLPSPPRTPHLAEAFLCAGVATMIGTFFDVGDDAARKFAAALHGELAAGKSVGEAVRAGRAALHRDSDPDWGNFVLYGDDRRTL